CPPIASTAISPLGSLLAQRKSASGWYVTALTTSPERLSSMSCPFPHATNVLPFGKRWQEEGLLTRCSHRISPLKLYSTTRSAEDSATRTRSGAPTRASPILGVKSNCHRVFPSLSSSASVAEPGLHRMMSG